MLGRKAPPRRPAILESRPLTQEDLRVLAKPRQLVHVVKTLREKHHRVARLDASGLSIAEICELTGMSPQTLYLYRQSPAYCELRAKFLEALNGALTSSNEDLRSIDHLRKTAIVNMRMAEDMLHEKLVAAQDGGDDIPVTTLNKIGTERMDRFGYGKHTTQTNVNVGLGNNIDAAIERVSRVRTIEGTTAPTPPLPSTQRVTHPASPAALPSRGIARRGF